MSGCTNYQSIKLLTKLQGSAGFRNPSDYFIRAAGSKTDRMATDGTIDGIVQKAATAIKEAVPDLSSLSPILVCVNIRTTVIVVICKREI
jgi:hypothetical protein